MAQRWHFMTSFAVATVVVTAAVAVVAFGGEENDVSRASLAADESTQGFTGGGSGYLRTPDGDLSPVNVPGATGTLPFGIDSRGKIVGLYDDADGVTHGFILEHGEFTTVDHPEANGVLHGLSGTGLVSINDHGQIVGSYVDGDRARGFVLDGGRFIPVDAPGAIETSAFGINDAGQITVQALNPDGSEPQYLLDRGRFTRVGFPGAEDNTVLHKINDRGQAVGAYADAPEVQHGFVLDRGRYTTVDVPGALVTGINDSTAGGRFVGYYANEGDTGVHGYVMRRGEVVTFDVPGFDNTTAYDINESGQIVGAGIPGTGTPSAAPGPAAVPGAAMMTGRR
jgi:uncharacterized membrane protein